MLTNSSTFSASPAEVFRIIRLIVMTVIFYSQLIVDSWASFAGNHDPNPERGVQSTLERLRKLGSDACLGGKSDGEGFVVGYCADATE
jgi:hypothetical protein